MLLKIINKKFSNFIKSQSNIKNLNSLIKYLDKNYQDFSSDDYISAMNKFQELELDELNPKIKLYDFLDYVLLDQKNLKDALYTKTIIRIMIGNNLFDKNYWDLIKENLINNNMIYNDKSDFLYYLKSFSIIEYKESNIWNIFEEFFLEKYMIFELEEIKQIALCFGNSKKGTDQFWEKLMDILESEDSNNIDFVLNFFISLGNYLNEIKSKDYDRKILFIEFMNKTIYYINAFIKDYEYDTKQVIYSFFKEFHQIYYVYKLHDFYEIKDDSIEFLVEELEILFLKHVKKNIKALKDDDIEGISKILLYFSGIKKNINFNYETDEDPKRSSKNVEMDFFVDVFYHNYEKFNKSSQILSFLNYFKNKEIEITKLKEIFESDCIWEKIIDDIHLFSVEELFNLTDLVKFYNIEYTRLWIFIQTFVRKQFEDLPPEKSTSNLEWIKKFMVIFDEKQFRLEDYILLQFIYFLRNVKDKLIVMDSYIKNNVEKCESRNKNFDKDLKF